MRIFSILEKETGFTKEQIREKSGEGKLVRIRCLVLAAFGGFYPQAPLKVRSSIVGGHEHTKALYYQKRHKEEFSVFDDEYKEILYIVVKRLNQSF
ncbi:MAG: hypothetical protein V4665_01475 [Patescibacteria group bacterium]